MWFTEQMGNNIGRITTAGVVTAEFTLPSAGSGPFAITAGPDGALWFAEISGNKIGRITTSGSITEYHHSHAEQLPQRHRGGTRRRAVVHRECRQQDRAHHHRRCHHQRIRYSHG